MPSLSLAIDARGAQAGANQFATGAGRAEGAARRLDAAVNSIDRRMGVLGRTAGSLGRSIAAMFGAFSAFKAVESATKAMIAGENALIRMNLAGRYTPDNMRAIDNAIKKLAITGDKTFSELASSFTDFEKITNNAAASIKAINAASNLSEVTLLNQADATQLMVTTMKQFNIAATDSERIADGLSTAYVRSDRDIGQMSERTKLAAAKFSEFGNTFEEFLGTMEALDRVLPGTAGFQKFTTIMDSLADPTTEAQKALRGMGLTMQDVNPHAHNAAEILETLRSKNISPSQANAIFEKSLSPIATLLIRNAGLFRDSITAYDDINGASQRLADTINNSVGEAIQDNVNALLEWGRSILSATSGPLLDMLKFTREVILALAGMDDALGDNSETAIETARILKSLAVGIGGVTAALAAARLATIAFSAVWATTPFGAAALVIGGIVSALYYFRDAEIEIAGTNATVWQAIKAVWASAKELFGELVDYIREAWQSLIDWFASKHDQLQLYLLPVQGIARMYSDLVGTASRSGEEAGEQYGSAFAERVRRHLAIIKGEDFAAANVPSEQGVGDGTLYVGGAPNPPLPGGGDAWTPAESTAATRMEEAAQAHVDAANEIKLQLGENLSQGVAQSLGNALLQAFQGNTEALGQSIGTAMLSGAIEEVFVKPMQAVLQVAFTPVTTVLETMTANITNTLTSALGNALGVTASQTLGTSAGNVASQGVETAVTGGELVALLTPVAVSLQAAALEQSVAAAQLGIAGIELSLTAIELGVAGVELTFAGGELIFAASELIFAATELAVAAGAQAGTAFFASGGLVTKPTKAIVGEAGPELIIPLSKLNHYAAGGVFSNVTDYMNSGGGYTRLFDLFNPFNAPTNIRRILGLPERPFEQAQYTDQRAAFQAAQDVQNLPRRGAVNFNIADNPPAFSPFDALFPGGLFGLGVTGNNLIGLTMDILGQAASSLGAGPGKSFVDYILGLVPHDLFPTRLSPYTYQRYAMGGVVDSPTVFRDGRSSMGLAGEAGPEAILPLSRGSDGKLGVAAHGKSVNIVMNVVTDDAASFRKSQRQIMKDIRNAAGF